LVAVDVIRLNSVKSFVPAEIQSGFHDRAQDLQLADIKPVFPGPTLVRFTTDC
jgi:hypothetical protein